MSVSYYDVLGVAPDASPDEVKAAWRDATDKFEPGSGTGQFRLFNEAADTLLDPSRRAAYDATLTSVAAPTTPPTPAAPVPAPVAPPPVAPEPTSPDRPESSDEAELSPGPSRGVVVVSAVLVVLSVVAFVLAGWFFLQHRSAARDAEAGDQASAAAERALPAVLSYDYRRLSADRDRAVKYLDSGYRKEYTATFDKLIESTPGEPGPAEQTKAVVKATVENVGLASATPDRARLIVFLNQATTKGEATPTFSLNRLAVTMVRDGRTWLVSDIVSY